MADGQDPSPSHLTSDRPNPGVTEADNAGLLVSKQPIAVSTRLQVPLASESVYIPSNATLPVGYSCSSYGASWKGVEFVGGHSVRPKTRRCRDVSVHMVLACVTFWLFGFVFGFVAFLLEFRAAQKLASGDVDGRKEARKLRKASLAVSVVGIVVGVAVIVAVVTTWQIRVSSYGQCYDYNEVPENECVQRSTTKFQWNTPSHETNPNLTLRIRPASRCQPTISKQGFVLTNQYAYTYSSFNTFPYFVKGKCYQESNKMSCQSCTALNGAFSNGRCYTNRYCYDTCSPDVYSIDRECYSSRRRSADGTCPVGQVYRSGYCYYTPIPDCNDGYFVDCTCYRKKTRNFTSLTCTSIGGYYVGDRSYVYHLPNGTSALADTNTCYYNSFECRGYVVNGQCYLTTTHDYTAGTCRLIGGYMDTDTCTCYNSGFACESPHYQKDGQCFVTVTDTASCTSCLNVGGYPVVEEIMQYFDSGDYHYRYSRRSSTRWVSTVVLRCYLHNNFTFDNATLSGCPYYAINTTRGPLCETHRTTAFNESECAGKGGTYIDNHCYYTPTECEDFLYNCTCYKYRSTAYDNDDCTNIGGTFDFRRNVCYYNSATCLYYTFNGKCYRHRDTYTQAEYCRGVYDSFYSYCYMNN